MNRRRTTRHSFKKGDRVRLTGKFLRSTGQYTGQDAQSKWIVLDVSDDGTMVAVNEPTDDSWYTPDERAAELQKWKPLGVKYIPRRINSDNLILASSPDYTNL